MNNLAKKIVEEATDEVNHDQSNANLIDKSPETLLLSSDSNIDSLTLVRLVVEIERLIEEKTGKSVVVVDESAFDSEESPFLTIGTLINHVEKLIK